MRAFFSSSRRIAVVPADCLTFYLICLVFGLGYFLAFKRREQVSSCYLSDFLSD